MDRRLAALALCAALLGTSGCTVLQGVFAESVGMPVQSKAVAYKSDPQELIATDGTSCFVSRGKFEDVEIGDAVLCAWTSEPRRDTHGG